jgi:hypothetical protein
MRTRTCLQIGMGFGAFIIWSGMAYFDPSLRADYTKFIISIVVGVGALALRDMPAIHKTEENQNEKTTPN